MFVADSQSEPRSPLAALRASAGLSLALARRGAATAVADLEERGGYRVKFPKGDIGTEAVFVNTGGGMVGGDRYRFDVLIGPGASATVASQSAERVYRSLDATAAKTSVTLRLDAEASLAWLPQETILFNGARLKRRIDVDMTCDASLLLCEAVIFGRAAMGEIMATGSLFDRWSVRRDGGLIFAEAVALEGDIQATLAHAAGGHGARALATLLYVAPAAEERCAAAREALGLPCARAAMSAWNGMMTARFLAPDSASLKADIVRVVTSLLRRPMPRVWNC
jgi:urease accessory protein